MKTILLFTVIFSFVSCKAQNDTIKLEFERGLNHYKNKNYKQAFKKFNNVIKLDSGYAEAYYYRGYIYQLNDSTYEKAYKDVDKAIRLGYQNAESYSTRGFLAQYITGIKFEFDPKAYEESLKDLNKALEIDSTYSSAYMIRSSIWNMIYWGKSDSAAINIINDLTKYIKYKPEDPRGYVGRAHAKRTLSDLKGACEDYKKAYNLGSTYMKDEMENFCKEVN